MKKSRKEFVNTRWTIRRDFPSIVEINNQSLPEITEDYLIHLHRNTQKPISLVAEIKEVVVGFVIYVIRKNRYEILHIATDKSYKRMGIATTLINNLKLKLSPSQEKMRHKDIYNYSIPIAKYKITCSVPDDLLPAHLFFKSCDFRGTITNTNSYRFEFKI